MKYWDAMNIYAQKHGVRPTEIHMKVLEKMHEENFLCCIEQRAAEWVVEYGQEDDDAMPEERK